MLSYRDLELKIGCKGVQGLKELRSGIEVGVSVSKGKVVYEILSHIRPSCIKKLRADMRTDGPSNGRLPVKGIGHRVRVYKFASNLK